MTDATPKKTAAEKDTTFEAAFTRLEAILEKMNGTTVSLDEALKLYEEADRLIHMCNKRLVDAEKRIEILIKNRNGDLTVGPDQKPATQEFHVPSPNQQKSNS
jgi:exodeoxyribonuclease VII small subunit